MAFKGVLSGVPAAVAALTALIFTATATREWTYYYGLGAVDFFYLVSPADYTSAALHWLPAYVLLCAIIAVLEMFLLRTEGFQSEEALAERSSTPPRTIVRRALPGLFFLAVTVVGGSLHLALGDNHTAKDWLMPAFGCWMVFSTWFSIHPHVHDRLAKTGRRLVQFGPMVAALIIADGYDEARKDLTLPRGEYRIVHSTGLVEDDIQLLRATSEGVLILRVPTRDVSFLTYRSFKHIDRIGSSQ